jgi:redox-sensitive bicupin YhaK (pirin superfamily)
MITRRPSGERGHFDHGWLDTYHTFSFAAYRDPRHAGFGDLLVVNEDRVQPARGFGAHSHRDMEILTYVVSGAVAHKDSMGNETRVAAGDVQRMSAGTGVTHSEVNPSRSEPVHFLQIWITPSETGLPPSYEQKTFRLPDGANGMTLIASGDGRQGSIRLHQHVDVLAGRLAAGTKVTHTLEPGRRAWVQVIEGDVQLDGTRLAAGDGAAVTDERDVRISTGSPAHLLLFDLR